jgi:hypothetical protein
MDQLFTYPILAGLLFYTDQHFLILLVKGLNAMRRQMTGNLIQCFQEYTNSFKKIHPVVNQLNKRKCVKHIPHQGWQVCETEVKWV